MSAGLGVIPREIPDARGWALGRVSVVPKAARLQEAPVLIRSLATDETAGSEALELDPLDKRCPEDLPCRVQDGDLWFSERPEDLERAKAFCRECPARAACFAGALERREPWGVWGAEIFQDGVVLPRKRPRGRPRKTPIEVAA
jgi:hypothetical protein